MFGSENGQIYCSKCRGTDEEDFRKVRNYLYDNPGASVQEVSKETGVEEQTIIRFLKQERIEIVEDENAILSCERCGVSIKTGRYCEKCKNEIKKELGSALQSLEKDKKTGMGYHTAHKNK
jgi:predicted transcriptional regulator